MTTDQRRPLLSRAAWITVLVFGWCPLFGQKPSNPAPCYQPDEYEQVLDAYFAHARGTDSRAVILRVYGGNVAEYELVLNPDTSNHSIVMYEPVKSIWGGAYDGLFTGRHRGLQDYISRALKVLFTKQEFDVSEGQFSDLVARAEKMDTTICEHLPLKNANGQSQFILDAPWFELIADRGNTRTKVTDTSDFKDVTSQNPLLLQWASELERILRDHARS